MFIRNAWYFAGFADEIGRHLLEREILGESIVFFRSEGGAAIALENRCPHRFAPLSMGNLVGDRVQCAYHGIEFDCSGRCVHIPGQDRIPHRAGVRAYPLSERWGSLWIWMGDADKADESQMVPEFRYLAEPGWTIVGGMKEVDAGYELIIDNLMDLTHIPFLHPGTLGNQGSANVATAEPKTTIAGHRVSVDRSVIACEPAPLFTRVRGLKEPVDRHVGSCFVPPCFVLIDLKVMPTGTQDIDRGLEWRVFHIVTPINAERTRYHWAVSRPFDIENENVSRELHQGTAATLEEDKVMIEAQARMLRGRSLDQRTLYTKYDATPAHVRRIIATIAAQEAKAPVAA